MSERLRKAAAALSARLPDRDWANCVVCEADLFNYAPHLPTCPLLELRLALRAIPKKAKRR